MPYGHATEMSADITWTVNMFHIAWKRADCPVRGRDNGLTSVCAAPLSVQPLPRTWRRVSTKSRCYKEHKLRRSVSRMEGQNTVLHVAATASSPAFLVHRLRPDSFAHRASEFGRMRLMMHVHNAVVVRVSIRMEPDCRPEPFIPARTPLYPADSAWCDHVMTKSSTRSAQQGTWKDTTPYCTGTQVPRQTKAAAVPHGRL
jgi:hypothetical protein